MEYVFRFCLTVFLLVGLIGFCLELFDMLDEK